MNYIQSQDEQRFAEFLTRELPKLSVEPLEVPRDEMWAAIKSRRNLDGLTAAPVAASVAAESGPGRNRTAEHRKPSIPVSRWSGSVRRALPIASLALVFAVGFGWYVDYSKHHIGSVASNSNVEAVGEMPTELAAEQHFTEVEQLLARFASSHGADASGVNTAAMEAELGMWARNLLSTTQLLLDSPLGLDPQRRKLLTDVEMVLVQIAQLAPNNDTDDREITERSIEKSQMMERLQHEVPSAEGKTSGISGTQRGS